MNMSDIKIYNCEQCGKEYTKNNHRQKYCSQRCNDITKIKKKQLSNLHAIDGIPLVNIKQFDVEMIMRFIAETKKSGKRFIRLPANFHFRGKMRGILLPTASVVSLDNLYVKLNGFDGINDVICLKSYTNSGIWIEFNKEWPL